MVQLQQWLGPCQLVHLPRAPSHCSGIGQCLGVGLAGTLLTATPPWAPRSLAHTDFCYSPAMRLDPGTMSVLTQTASAPRRKSWLKAVRRWVAQYLKKLYCTFSKAKRRTSLVIEMSNNWSATGWALPCTGRCGIMLILKEFSFFFHLHVVVLLSLSLFLPALPLTTVKIEAGVWDETKAKWMVFCSHLFFPFRWQ